MAEIMHADTMHTGTMHTGTVQDDIGDPDMQAHYATYRTFVRYSTIFAAHVVVILALMAYFLV